jgi:hypothetical protein
VSKSRVKVEIKDYLIQHGQYLARVFLIRYLSDFKKQIKQNLAYFYTKNSKNRHLLSAIFRLFSDLTAILYRFLSLFKKLNRDKEAPSV